MGVVYVCPTCFGLPEYCICENKPEYLIEIDSGMEYSVRELNRRGYITMYCCESHYNVAFNIYIMFAGNYAFGTLPDGFKFSRHGLVIEHIMRAKTLKGFEKEKTKYIEKLNKWVDTLPEALK